MEQGLTLQVVIRISRAGRGLSIAVGAGLPRFFGDPGSARAFVGGLGADLREFDAWVARLPGSAESL